MTHVFVGGAQRSGTTLLATLLCAGPETNEYLGESSGLRSLVETYEFMRRRFGSEGIAHFRSRAAFDSYFRTVLGSFFTVVMATQAPASRLVLKEPHMTLYFPHLYHLVPGCRFVLIKRDPRDVVVSMLKVGERLAAAGKSHFYNEADIATIAAEIRGFYEPIHRAEKVNPKFAETCLWVKYEDLVTDPHAVLAQLREHTGLSLQDVDPLNPGKPRAEVEAISDDRRLRPWVTDIQASGELSSDAVGRYREHLSPDELLKVEMAACDLIQAFGYEFETEEAAALAKRSAEQQ